MKFCKYYLYHLTCRTTRTTKTTSCRAKVANRLLQNFYFAFFTIIFFSFLAYPLKAQQVDSSTNTANSPTLLNQLISFHAEELSIEEILNRLSTEKQIRFSYINYELPIQNKVTLHYTEQPLKLLLDSLFSNTGIKYYLIAKQIVLKKEYEVATPKEEIIPSLVKETSGLSISLFVGPGISNRTLKADDNSSTLVTDRNKDETGKTSLIAGCYLTYSKKNSFSFRTGIRYISLGEKGSHSYTFKSKHPTTPPQAQNPQKNDSISTVTVSYRNRYNYTCIPLMAGYTLSKNNWSVSAFTGLDVMLLINRSSTYPDDLDQYIKEQSDNSLALMTAEDPSSHSYRKIALGLPISIELGYRLNKNFNIFLSPSFIAFLNSIYVSSSPLKQYPYSFNMLAGISYTLNTRK